MKGFFATLGIVGLALGLAACGNDNRDESSANEGASVFAANCATCHGLAAAGAIGPNITGSMSAGIGSWSEEDFFTAVRMGVDDQGEMLCELMPRFSQATLSDTRLASIYHYLLTLVSDTENAGTGCP